MSPFSTGLSKKEFLLMVVNYFSKWVEAEALTRIIEEAILKFLWNMLMWSLWRLISNNGRQFQWRILREWYKELGVQRSFTSMAYPQSNGYVEVVNRHLVRGLKMKFSRTRGN